MAKIGYTFGNFRADNCKITLAIHRQSPDIAMGVDSSVENRSGGDLNDLIGAGDQGMMFGYACNETAELMPLTAHLANRLAKRLTDVRKCGLLPYLRPDGKTQVTVEYEGRVPKRVDTVVVSCQHNENVYQDMLREDIKKYVIDAVIPGELLDEGTKYYINPTGRFEIGGPEGDSGLTGRKIIVDTYGGYCPHGGGALSGKDPSKVDRSGLYMARYICKNLVAAKVCKRVEIEVAYAIGRARPVSVHVDSFGTGVVSDEKIAEIVSAVFDLRPAAIIKNLRLARPIFRATSNYGHLGRGDFTWEKTDKVEEIAKVLAKYTI